MPSAPQPLADLHQFADFDSGELSPDNGLKRRAAKHQVNGSSRTYVVCEGAAQNRVIGCYCLGLVHCLAAGAIGPAQAPPAMKTGFVQHPHSGWWHALRYASARAGVEQNSNREQT